MQHRLGREQFRLQRRSDIRARLSQHFSNAQQVITDLCPPLGVRKQRRRDQPFLKRFPAFAPYWGVTIREGRHQALISIETHDRIISRLKGDKRAPARKDLSKDFPLRGFVNCACGTPLTASWPRGRSGHYAYYFCFNRGCESYGKSIRRDKIEGEFEVLLKELAPSANLVRLAADMFERAWEMRRRTMTGRLDGLRALLRDTERQIEATVDRVVEAKTQVVAHALEERVEKLTKEKLALAEKIARGAQPLKSFEQSLRTALTFLAEPWKLWNSDRIEHKRAVLKLAFSGNLQYARNEGFRTADLALPFMALANFSAVGKGMVGQTGALQNPEALLETLAEWDEYLKKTAPDFGGPSP